MYYKALAALLIFLASIATVVYPLKRNGALKHTESVSLGEALASGIFLGAAFFHMLPDSIRLFASAYGASTYPIPEIICVGGFLLLLFLERLSLNNSSIQAKNFIPYLLAVTLIIHALAEGAALGMGSSFTDTTMLFIAIIAHKGSESFALCVTLLRYQLPHKKLLLIILLFSIMTPLGIALGTSVGNARLAQATLSAFAAGTFLYMSTLHHVHFHKHERDAHGMLEFACLALGLIAMAIIALWT